MQLENLVAIRGDYTDSIDLKINFEDEEISADFIARFLPSESSVNAILSIARGMNTNVKCERAHLITGSYGVGKSLTGLVVANMFARPHLKEIHDLIDSIKQDWPDEGKELEILLKSVRGCYLPVLLQGNEADSVNEALLSGLRISLNKYNLSNIIPKIAFEIAIERINEWRKDDEILYRRYEEALQQKAYTPNKLQYELGDYSEKALSIFEEIHKKVTTSSFEYYKSDREARDFYSQVVDKLKSQNTGFCGIVVIWDEHGQILRMIGSTQDHQTGAYLEEQHFCQYCKEKYNDQVNYVSIAHMTQREYFSTEAAYQDYKKSSGRLTELLLEPQRGEEICGRAIVQLFEKNAIDWQDLRNEGNWQDVMNSIKKYNLYPSRDDNWIRSELIEGAFPLHPITLYCLPRVSAEVSQLTRTSLSFINDANGLAGFLRNDVYIEPGRLNFFTIDKLFDYFDHSIEQSKHRKIASGCKNGLKYVAQDLLKTRILKAIAILQLLPSPNLIAKTETLIDVLYISASERDELRKAIDELEEEKIIRKRNTGELRLLGGGDYDYMEEFRSTRKIVQGTITNPLKEFNRLAERELPLLNAPQYNSKYGMDRELDKELFYPEELLDISNIEAKLNGGDYLDGWVMWIVANTNSEVTNATQRASKITNKQIIIAIPNRPSDLLNKLIDKKTAEEIERNAAIGEKSLDSDDIDFIKEQNNYYNNEFTDAVREFTDPSNSTWYWKGNVVKAELNTTQDLRNFISRVMEEVFPNTPKITQDRIAYKWSNFQKKDRINAMDYILNTHKPLELRRSGRENAVGAIIKGTLFDTGLLKYKGHGGGDFDNYEVENPKTDEPAYNVWEAMNNILKDPNLEHGFVSIVDKLKLPPFGLSANAIEMLLAAWIRFNWTDLIITDSNSNIPDLINGDIINSIVSYPEDYELIFEKLTENQKRILNGLLISLTGKAGPGGKVSSAEVTNRLEEWYEQLPENRSESPDISDKAKDMLDVIDKTVNGDIEIQEALFVSIPRLLEVTEPKEGQQLPLDYTSAINTVLREIDGKKTDIDNFSTLKNTLRDILLQHPKTVMVAVLKSLLEELSDD